MYSGHIAQLRGSWGKLQAGVKLFSIIESFQLYINTAEELSTRGLETFIFWSHLLCGLLASHL